MPRYAIKIDEYYLEWSTIVDAPITYGMTETEYREFYLEEYGRIAEYQLEPRMQRIAQNGTSTRYGGTVEELLSHNRAGPHESELTVEEIKRAYCEGLPIREGWVNDPERGWRKEGEGEV